MSTHRVPLDELAVAVQNAVQQVLGKHGAVSIEKLWVGFVAPENIANQEVAGKLAAQLGREAGVHAQGSVAQELVASAAGPPAAQIQKPGHIIGLVFAPKAAK